MGKNVWECVEMESLGRIGKSSLRDFTMRVVLLIVIAKIAMRTLWRTLLSLRGTNEVRDAAIHNHAQSGF
ncbi:hypothetical protein [Helicobacter sp. MIT 05-5294]|uniref:hypothetical protein n=1 Tax=Helicobacter sp. MIT 05-5294 TaxID=1548150 RepID=UPI00051FCDC1|nr:hypothetical protein [Helicobacter sp. MIT 05-5294]TLD86501.1 hypothetical protein LS69_005735 [Helicobacter sp. MIT 05-5294]